MRAKFYDKERIHGHLCIFAANIIFGIYIPISKYMLRTSFGEVLTLFRMWVQRLYFWIASIFVHEDKVDKKDILLMMFFGLFGIALNQGLFICGLGMTSPVDASVIVTATPLMVMVMAALFMSDPITRRKGVGVFLGASGALWLVLSTNHIQNSTGTFGGDVVILLSGLSTAIYYSLSKPLTSRHSPITLMKWMFLFSSIFFLPFTPSFCRLPRRLLENSI
ncbi:MAG: DMT family transporter [Bacilli bacterium]